MLTSERIREPAKRIGGLVRSCRTQWFEERADEVAKLERVARAANAVIDDWPDTIYGDDDPEINHWVILHKLKVALADLPEDALK